MTARIARRHHTALLASTAAVMAMTLGGCSRGEAPTAHLSTPSTTSTASPSTSARSTSASEPVTTATPGPSRPVTATALPVSAPAPAKPADPSGIPWGTVGLGWTVASYSSHGADSVGHSPGPFHVVLISPTGVRYPVVDTDDSTVLQDVTPDGRRAVGYRYHPDGTSDVVELDLAARSWHTVKAGLALRDIRYTAPAGEQLLAQVRSDTSVQDTLLRMDRSGHVTLTLPGQWGSLVSTADGRLLVSDDPGGTVAVRDNATGRTLRTVRPPAGYTGCSPSALWRGNDVSVRCVHTQPSLAQMMEVLVLDASTGTYRAVTHADASDEREVFGYVTAWPVGDRVLAMRGTGCGPGPTGVLGRDGRIASELTWPHADSSPYVLGVAGTSVVASFGSCDSDGTTLLAQDALTHRTTTLLTAATIRAVVIDGR